VHKKPVVYRSLYDECHGRPSGLDRISGVTSVNLVPSVELWLLTGDFPAISTTARRPDVLTFTAPTQGANGAGPRATPHPTATATGGPGTVT
jgi:hypothetical protein